MGTWTSSSGSAAMLSGTPLPGRVQGGLHATSIVIFHGGWLTRHRPKPWPSVVTTGDGRDLRGQQLGILPAAWDLTHAGRTRRNPVPSACRAGSLATRAAAHATRHEPMPPRRTRPFSS